MKTSEFFALHPVFSLDQAVEELDPPGGRSGMVERLKHYLGDGRLHLANRGIYAVVPPGTDSGPFRPDPFLVASTVRLDAIFSYHSALELLGAAHSLWNQCTVFTAKRRKALRLKGTTIRFLEHPVPLRAGNANRFATQKIERRGRMLVVTSPERTLVEGFRKLSLAGGDEEFVRSAESFPTLDLGLLEKVLLRYDIAGLWAACGWFLERFQKTFHVPGNVLLRMEKRRPKSPQYLERGRLGGTLAARWNLIHPKSLLRLGEPDEPQS